MFSIKRSYKFARARIDELRNSSPPDEAFELIIFFVEKLVRRTLIQLVIRNGKSQDEALAVVKKIALRNFNDAWPKHDPLKRKLGDLIGTANWTVIDNAALKRNDLVHGSDNKGQRVYAKAIPALITTLDTIKPQFTNAYGYFGWRA